MKASRALRHRRREQAILVAERLKPEIHTVRINDTKGSHITIWIEEGRRIEWWPATERWQCWQGRTHFGNPLELVRFIRADLALAREVEHASS